MVVLKRSIKRRMVESGARKIGSHCVYELEHSARVKMQISLELPSPPAEIWATVGNLPAFLTIDPFHYNVAIVGSVARAGARMILRHRVLGIPVIRLGKLLYFKEGEGYAFSDLSGTRTGKVFPHIFVISLHAHGKNGTTLRIAVQGKWPVSRLTKYFRNIWLASVCKVHARLLVRAFAIKTMEDNP